MVRTRRWFDGLPLETVRRIQRRHPGKSLDQIAVWAIRRPGYDELFADLAKQLEDALGADYRYWKWIVELPRGFTVVRLPPPEFEKSFQQLLVAAALEPEANDDRRLHPAPDPAPQTLEPEVEPASEPATTRPKRGRRNSPVSVLEANAAAQVYMQNPTEYDRRSDGGAYAVHKLYKEDREGGALLSRPMVGHLLAAMRAGLLPWDGVQNALRIPDEFRTRPGQFEIPRP